MSAVLNIGITCPQCASSDTAVTDSRPWAGWIRRRRKCQECDHRWSTVEVPSDLVDKLPHMVEAIAKAVAAVNHLTEAQIMLQLLTQSLDGVVTPGLSVQALQRENQHQD